jgi:hypothetical protein
VKALRARPFGSLAATLSYYQMSNLDPTGWSRLLAVCICAAGVDMITMLEPKEIASRDSLRHPSARRHGH